MPPALKVKGLILHPDPLLGRLALPGANPALSSQLNPGLFPVPVHPVHAVSGVHVSGCHEGGGLPSPRHRPHALPSPHHRHLRRPRLWVRLRQISLHGGREPGTRSHPSVSVCTHPGPCSLPMNRPPQVEQRQLPSSTQAGDLLYPAAIEVCTATPTLTLLPPSCACVRPPVVPFLQLYKTMFLDAVGEALDSPRRNIDRSVGMADERGGQGKGTGRRR